MTPGSPSLFQYQDTVGKLRLYIEEQKLRHGDRLPPERKFAELFGVGRPTVNKAIACLIAEGFLRRDGYKLYVAGSPLTAPKAAHIGVLCPHPLHKKQRIFHNLVEAAHDVCHLAKVGFTPMLSVDGPQQQEQLLEMLKLKTDGIVIWPHPDHDYMETFKRITDRNIPLVVNDCNWGPFDYVGVDNFAGIQTILEHLAKQGHLHIAYVTKDMSYPNVEQRCEAYRYLAARMFSESSPGRIYEIPLESEESLPEIIKKIQRKDKEVTAICCSHDMVAIEVIRACLQQGIDVPEQISVTGFDGIEAGETCHRPLTTVCQDFYQMGLLAVDLLIRRIRMKHIRHAAQIQQIRVIPHLVVRSSTARPPERSRRMPIPKSRKRS